MDHLQACGHCPNHDESFESGCSIYWTILWVKNAGCPHFPHRYVPEGKGRSGQQKQKHQDRSYSGKNDRRSKYGRREH